MISLSHCKISILLASCILLFGCYSNENNSKTKDSLVNRKTSSNATFLNENFDAFFKKFESDSIFQLSRINFPLKITSKSEDGDSIRIFNKNQWKYIHLSSQKFNKNIIKKIQTQNKQVNIQLSIEDTGVLVNHFFTIKNGKWWLDYIIDESD